MPQTLIADLHIQGQMLVGWVVNPSALSTRYVVEIDQDSEPLTVVRADTFIPKLRDTGYGDGCYGFAVAIDGAQLSNRHSRHRYSLRIANDHHVLASASTSVQRGEEVRLGGQVVWRGGLRVSGKLTGFRLSDLSGKLQVFEGSERLEITAFSATSSDDEDDSRFDLFLPATLADGKLHWIRVLDPHGTELDGSPLWVVSDVGGFRGLTARAAQAAQSGEQLDDQMLDYLDLLLPASLPFESYGLWSRDLDADWSPQSEDAVHVGVVIIGRIGHETTLASLREQVGRTSVRVGILDTDDGGRFRADAWTQLQKALLRDGSPKAILVVRSGTSLSKAACCMLADALAPSSEEPASAQIAFTDHTLFNEGGLTVPVLEPAFDYERLLSQGYAEGLFALSPEIMARIQFNDVPCSAFDILFTALEHAQAPYRGQVVHLPRLLGRVPQRPPRLAATLLGEAVRHHMLRTGSTAEIQAMAAQTFAAATVRRPLPDGDIEVLVPTRDRLDLLKSCLDTLFERTARRDFRVTVIDNGSVERETIAYLTAMQERGAITVLRDDGPFNYSRLNNRAVGQSSATFICFLNNDVEIISPGWLAAMQSYFSRPDVGAVGAKLVWPNRMLQHGGVVLGTGFAASHGYDRYLADEPGYLDGIRVARECGALTAACMMVRRSDFLAVGGFDEATFPVAFNDVDLSLKLRAAGKVLVWTPEAELLHKESASRSKELGRTADRTRADKELAELRAKWPSALIEDPYYNPNLNLDAYTFTGLAVPPRRREPRQNQPPRPGS